MTGLWADDAWPLDDKRAWPQVSGRWDTRFKVVSYTPNVTDPALFDVTFLVGLDVANIAAQYELAAGAEARPFFIAPNPSNSNIVFRTFTSILPDVTLTGTKTAPTLLIKHLAVLSHWARVSTTLTVEPLPYDD